MVRMNRLGKISLVLVGFLMALLLSTTQLEVMESNHRTLTTVIAFL